MLRTKLPFTQELAFQPKYTFLRSCKLPIYVLPNYQCIYPISKLYFCYIYVGGLCTRRETEQQRTRENKGERENEGKRLTDRERKQNRENVKPETNGSPPDIWVQSDEDFLSKSFRYPTSSSRRYERSIPWELFPYLCVANCITHIHVYTCVGVCAPTLTGFCSQKLQTFNPFTFPSAVASIRKCKSSEIPLLHADRKVSYIYIFIDSRELCETLQNYTEPSFPSFGHEIKNHAWKIAWGSRGLTPSWFFSSNFISIILSPKDGTGSTGSYQRRWNQISNYIFLLFIWAFQNFQFQCV